MHDVGGQGQMVPSCGGQRTYLPMRVHEQEGWAAGMYIAFAIKLYC